MKAEEYFRAEEYVRTEKHFRSDLLEVLCCPACGGELIYQEEQPNTPPELICRVGNHTYSTHQGIPSGRVLPIFTTVPEGMAPSEKLRRGPEVGTPWRQANWRFLETQLKRLKTQETGEPLILDVGAGRGDFAAALQNHNSLALDVYPYPEVDVVCDLTRANPFRPASFDAALLLNVMEHVYDTHRLLTALTCLLKPGGLLIAAIPFLVKIHQAPIDYVRYTHFALQQLGGEHGLNIDFLEGYYDPIFFLDEGIGNLRNAVLPTLSGSRRYLALALLASIQALSSLLQRITGPGRSKPPSTVRSLAPTGYHIVYRKG
jgi:uncharacterized protein YbaR (Trm112 family)/SAM-dependent methyltransferase